MSLQKRQQRRFEYICVNMNLKSYIIDTSFKELGNEYTKLEDKETTTKHEGMIFLVIDHLNCKKESWAFRAISGFTCAGLCVRIGSLSTNDVRTVSSMTVFSGNH